MVNLIKYIYHLPYKGFDVQSQGFNTPMVSSVPMCLVKLHVVSYSFTKYHFVLEIFFLNNIKSKIPFIIIPGWREKSRALHRDGACVQCVLSTFYCTIVFRHHIQWLKWVSEFLSLSLSHSGPLTVGHAPDVS